mmetsp:Transcript_19618/g.36094  ORF Transcript_19618/g.36094 Transcript_19618/m.36094 type:complete len:287 (-) Transcript_19618:963-1823(-)|eukprot:CAMPEP_0204899788 /NCGR_PEP_ID=MMETSP1397-20131031/2052_1 /ASSEMBLY_ACC=CAM_ASM_000891 /TAXON_ID=49980 /ORGANISM="Climacostomum Climacostomum virens, Strain Stock W-24" /LENGTH=286 /DNA_ID=CAMNT_0052067787 /DNA_START=104 /DNA_END=964 /DNA_ORIENTATION=+
MVSRTTTEEVFKTIKSNPENERCFECGTGETPFVSLSLAIFLCHVCAEVHRTLGVNLSFVRSIDFDSWSIKQLKIVSAGGNEKLREFFGTYCIPPDYPIETKYRLVAAEYYRQRLATVGQSLVFDVPPPTLEEGLRPIEAALDEAPSAPELPEQKKSGFGRLFASAVSMTKKAAGKISEGAQKVKESPTYQAVSSTAKSTLNTVGQGIQAGANWTAEKGKVITENPKVQATMISVKSAVSSTVTRIQENETVQRVSERTATALSSLEKKVSSKMTEIFRSPDPSNT